MTNDTAQTRTHHSDLELQVSSEMVGLFKDLFGRGPTRARTYFAGPNLLLCVLEGTLVPAERTLVDMGEHQRLRETRLFFQHAREQDFRDAIERITGRRVVAFTSATDTVADVSTEVFHLEPFGLELASDTR
jgi:uncharacterized protein YbcI